MFEANNKGKKLKVKGNLLNSFSDLLAQTCKRCSYFMNNLTKRVGKNTALAMCQLTCREFGWHT